MITCERCGSVNGQGTKGDSWICEDCRMKPIPESHEDREEVKAPPRPAVPNERRSGT